MKARHIDEPAVDFSRGVRGKYYQRAMAGSNVVLLDPDLLESFPDSETVNAALRSLRDVALRAAPSRPRAARKKTA